MTAQEAQKLQEITLADGRRVFIFGCTVFCGWLFVYMIALVIVAASAFPRIPRPAIQAYAACVATVAKSNKKDSKALRCDMPAATVSKGVSAKIIDVGAAPWTAVLTVFLFCGLFYLIQSKEDFQRTREILHIGAVYANKNAKLSDLPKQIEAAVQKTGEIVLAVAEKVVPKDTEPTDDH